ncbi:hypothetical protein NMG46_29320, partial [Mesorhizobium sp. LMG 17147]|uniref:hypothetical protein n=1 Tax=Mesorhizobium sp. LMG 17147 TaxID=2963091 RepID=UPI0020C96C2B
REDHPKAVASSDTGLHSSQHLESQNRLIGNPLRFRQIRNRSSGVEGVQSFDDLTIAQTGTDTIITAGVDQVTLANFTNTLTTSDFLFV